MFYQGIRVVLLDVVSKADVKERGVCEVWGVGREMWSVESEALWVYGMEGWGRGKGESRL